MYKIKQKAKPVLSKFGKKYFCGIGEVMRKNDTSVRGYDLDKAIKLVKLLNVKSHRLWMLSSLFNSDLTINHKSADEYHEVIWKLRNNGVKQIIGLGSFYNLLNGGLDNYVPDPADAQYQKFMDGYETIWYNLVREFQDLAMFEIGNETNFSVFMQADAGSEEAARKKRADATAALMFRGGRGIKAADSKAFKIFPGMSPTEKGMASGEMKLFLELVYENIRQGKFGSTENRDYFDALAWHPYTFITPFSDSRWGYMPDMDWVRQNNEIYAVAEKYGDKGIKVFFTEYGFSDFGNYQDCIDYAEYYKKSFYLIKKYMPYVEAVHVFRLFEDTLAQNWGGKTEIYYGLFKEPHNNLDITPKKTAYAIQKIFGGKGDLNIFNKGEQR